MLGKFWFRRIRPGYWGQVMTAGALLAVVSFLLFSVVSTLEVAKKPPVLKTTPAVEPVPVAEQAAVNKYPNANDGLNSGQKQAPGPQITVVPASTATVDSNIKADNQTIQELWSGTKIQGFGWEFHPVYRDWRYHNGIDISGSEGQIVPAVASGEIVDIYTDKQYGLTVVVASGKYIIYYGSLASIVVQKNNMITSGSPIGSMGISANELEPHLHLAVKNSSSKEFIDPREAFLNIPN
ncbi:hypothetical protein SRRS_41030 [Sporomusa rhizae]|uniref:peptidoglycan DD-metalloendopeptidase family protein n=1 Tax=Sporomusa rhizae TaxID=357999 RepID=UPI00352A8DFF